MAKKTPEQREAARRRREARKLRALGQGGPSRQRNNEPVSLRDLSEKVKNFDPMDYSPETGWKRQQRQVLALIEELEVMVEGKPPAEIDHTMVGDMASIRVHLEKAIAHAKSAKFCLNCPTNDLPKIRKHTRG